MGDMSEDGMSADSGAVLESKIGIDSTVLKSNDSPSSTALSRQISTEAMISASPALSPNENLHSNQTSLEKITHFILIHPQGKLIFLPRDPKNRADQKKDYEFTCAHLGVLSGPVFTMEQAMDYKKLLPEVEFCGVACYIRDCPAYIKTNGYNTNSK